MKLNPQQQAAVKYLGGPLLVLAGAGSGKTGVITQKIKHLIVNVGYLPHTVAAITFTNKAATEMQERVSKMLPKSQTRGLTICTFHSLGMKILREEANQIGYKKNFSILDSTDSAKIIGELLGGTGKEAIFKAQHQISLWKNDLKTPEDVVQTASNVWEQQTARVYASYQETLQSYQAVDFDDLIRLPAVLLQQNSEVRNKWQRRLRYLLVDECQDTNTCQFTLMKLLTGAEGMFTAVGDDDQSIYAWRGANMENLRKMQEDYPQMKVIKLEQNYRSTARILKIANKVIENNPKLFTKKLWSQFGEGEIVKVVACQSEQHEADWVVSQIVKQKLVGGDKTQYADFAVLYRGNHQARIFEEALRSARVPYQLSGGQSFFDKAEIKDVLSYLRLLANPNGTLKGASDGNGDPTTSNVMTFDVSLNMGADAGGNHTVSVNFADTTQFGPNFTVADREVELAAVMSNPNIAVIRGLLSDEECDEVIRLSRGKMKASQVVDRESGGSYESSVRRSEGSHFERGENELVRRIEARLSALVDLPVNRGEPLQILHYGPGGEYKAHQDFFEPKDPGSAVLTRVGGQRGGGCQAKRRRCPAAVEFLPLLNPRLSISRRRR